MTVNSMRAIPFLVVALVALAATRSSAQVNHSNCADCHSMLDAPARDHFDEWERSPHGRNDVGCERCHDGNPNSLESFEAHRGVLASRNPASPVNRANIPRTCGGCHPGPYQAFQQSPMFALLGKGDERVPVCLTCHTSVGAELLSPRRLEAECNRCHGPKGVAPRPGRAAGARLLLEGVSDARESLKAARRLIERVQDPERRKRLETAYTEAEHPLLQARDAGHRFVFDTLQVRITTARQRIAILFAQLVNPAP